MKTEKQDKRKLCKYATVSIYNSIISCHFVTYSGVHLQRNPDNDSYEAGERDSVSAAQGCLKLVHGNGGRHNFFSRLRRQLVVRHSEQIVMTWAKEKFASDL